MGDRTYSDLDIYKRAHKLAGDVHDVMGFVDDEQFEDIVDETRHAAREVVRFISDAWTHRHFPGTMANHLTTASNEVGKCLEILKKSHEQKLIPENYTERLINGYVQIQQEIHDFIETGVFK